MTGGAALLAAASLLATAAPDAGTRRAGPNFETLSAQGPKALPALARMIRQCNEDSLMAGSVFVAIADGMSEPPDAVALAPDLLRGLDCEDLAVRRIAARALGRLVELPPASVAALRKRLRSDRRPDGRALAATVLAAVHAGDEASIRALARALSDPSESVQLASAAAFVLLMQPERARSALQRLATSKDPQIAAAAASLLGGRGMKYPSLR